MFKWLKSLFGRRGETGTDQDPAYTVLVDDNYRYMDEEERYKLGDYPTAAAAIDAARSIVDNWLAANYQPGMSAEKLYQGYTTYGEDPFIVAANGENVAFSAWDYARLRCAEICVPKAES